VNKKIFVRAVLIAWIVLWSIFLVRPFFKKGLLNEYGALLKLSAEDKRAYVTGRDLYAFIKSCKESVKEPSGYKVTGLEKDSLEQRRFTYYMYPSVESGDPEYIFDAEKHTIRKAY
jgi:hypothetical protein